MGRFRWPWALKWKLAGKLTMSLTCRGAYLTPWWQQARDAPGVAAARGPQRWWDQVRVPSVHAQSLRRVPDSVWPHGLQPAGSSVHGTLQARILEWVAIFFSTESSWPRDRTHVCQCPLHCRQNLYLLSYLGSPHNPQRLWEYWTIKQRIDFLPE